jgi:hypothetical protein
VNQTTPEFVRVPSTPEDRRELLALAHRAGHPGKPIRQTRSNDNRKAIKDSQEES